MEGHELFGTLDKDGHEGNKSKINLPTYALIRFADVGEDIQGDVVDLITGTLERFPNDPSSACKILKERMDRLYGNGWHIIIGENFAYDVTYEAHHLIYLYFGGNLGVLLWKCC